MCLQKGVNLDMERSYQYDIVVVGGGTAGVAAAVGAAKAGAKTLWWSGMLISAERRRTQGLIASVDFIHADRIRFGW